MITSDDAISTIAQQAVKITKLENAIAQLLQEKSALEAKEKTDGNDNVDDKDRPDE